MSPLDVPLLYTVSQKNGATVIMAVTCQFLIYLQNFLTAFNKTDIRLPTAL